MKTKNMIAIIPARGGSKGLPRKNIHKLNSKPLISYTVESALACDFIDKVAVSTEDDEIAEVAKKFGASVIKRPVELAQDETPAKLVVKHAIDTEKDEGTSYKYIILLQPTSPMRNRFHITEAVSKLESLGAASLISVVVYDYVPFKCFVINK